MKHGEGKRNEHGASHVCAISNNPVAERDAVQLGNVRPTLADFIRTTHPGIDDTAWLSRQALASERADYIAQTLREEKGDLGQLERDVVESLARDELLSENVEAELDESRTFGERASDLIASFGGSWTFILSFCAFIVVWMCINIAIASAERFDPYPFILLNLVLSCVAALQAPVIMMSQRRQEAKDRSRSENDYRVNLKAELEIRHLHEKIDHMLTSQWKRLAEIQSIQIELMEDLVQRRR
ncbi:MAG TPA: DUF1003 domain-containing protein [Ancylobacter sp.]